MNKKLKQVGQEDGVAHWMSKTTETKSSREMFVTPHGTRKHPTSERERSMVEHHNKARTNG